VEGRSCFYSGENVKILILEDEDEKFEVIQAYISQIISEFSLRREKNWLDYSRAIANTKFDLILLDLLVPRSPKDSTVEDHLESLVSTTRDYDSQSFSTPAIVLTRQNLDSGDFVHDLNKVDINVIPFNDHGDWKEALKVKILAAQPRKKFDFSIICALEKEMAAFEHLVDSWGALTTISGLMCREVRIGTYKGVIVRAHRMGLVAAAVVTTMALERFEPRLICMSGICGGVPGEGKIYDLLVTQICHQHDAGKWSSAGFKSEHYDVQLDVDVHSKLIELCSGADAGAALIKGLIPSKSEFPEGAEEISCQIHPEAATSSGSAVIAEDGKTTTLATGQRKLAGFEMEIYSVYEAARHALHKPVFFAAKSVVDDGGANKGDRFHRIACLISAKFIVKAISAGIADLRLPRRHG
jgi:nucleoside phosphorylase/CheY-like chemotaxis protein